MITEKILNYQIGNLIGEGSAGRVYTAIHTQLGRKVAIKIFTPENLNTETKAIFKQEAKRLTQLQHLHIVTLYDYFETPEEVIFIQEFAHGQSLQQYLVLQNIPMDESKALFFMFKIAEAVNYAHQKGILHLNLKPSNIIITPDANVKITDFGIATLLQNIQQNKATTSCYLSPEQVMGNNPDHRTDIYSLGIILWELLSGKSLEKELNFLEKEQLHTKIKQDKFPYIVNEKVVIKEKLLKIIEKATEKQPEKRFQTCSEFSEALQTALLPNNTINISRTIVNNKNKTEKDKQKAKQKRMLYFFGVTFISIFTILLVVQIFSGGKKDSSITLAENNKKTEVATEEETNKTKNLAEEVEEEKEKTEDEKTLDSLKIKQKNIDKEIQNVKERRRTELLKALVIDTQLEDEKFGELTIQVSLSNTHKEANFRNIILHTIFTNEDGKELEPDKREIASLKAEQNTSYKIVKNIGAGTKFTTKLKNIEVEDKNPPAMVDSLKVKYEKIEEKIEKLTDKIREDKKKKAEKNK